MSAGHDGGVCAFAGTLGHKGYLLVEVLLGSFPSMRVILKVLGRWPRGHVFKTKETGCGK